MRSFDFVWIRSDRRVIAAADMEDEYIVGYYSQQVEALGKYFNRPNTLALLGRHRKPLVSKLTSL